MNGMWRVAFENLRVRKIRTGLSLLGLAVAVAGVIGLVSLSTGVTESLRSGLTLIRGVVVLEAKKMDPIFSRLPVALVDRIRALPEVRAAAGETWMLAASIDGHATLTEGIFTPAGLGAMDDAGRDSTSDGGFYKAHRVAGRWVTADDRDVVILSRHMAEAYQKRLGDPVNINGHVFTVVGLYHTGSLFLDQACLIPFAQAAEMRGYKESYVSSIYVEPKDRTPEGLEAAAHAIQTMVGDDLAIDALTPKRWMDQVSGLLEIIHVFLLAVSSFACIVGAIGVLNTMLMSVSERVREFGILKAVGWTRSDVARLVVIEAAGLGVLGGAVGAGLGLGVVALMAPFLPFAPIAPWWVVEVGFVGAVGLGLLGGLYPAWRAASMDPVEAIRWE